MKPLRLLFGLVVLVAVWMPGSGAAADPGLEGVECRGYVRILDRIGDTAWIEVFVENRGDKPVVIKEVIPRGPKKNFPFQYIDPSPEVAPGKVVCVRILEENGGRVAREVDLRFQGGGTKTVLIPKGANRYMRLFHCSFSRSRQKAYVMVTGYDVAEKLPQVFVNGKEVRKSGAIEEIPLGYLNFSFEGVPRYFAVELETALEMTEPAHLRLVFDELSDEAFVKPYCDFARDSYGVGERDFALRAKLKLQNYPSMRVLELDVACLDTAQKKVGKHVPAVAARMLEERKLRSSHVLVSYCCTLSAPTTLPLYGGITDGVAVCPYSLNYILGGGAWPHKVVEQEEPDFLHALVYSGPKPWFWFPECFTLGDRILERQELRQQCYAALGFGCRGVKYFQYGSGNGITGFEKSPGLLAEVVRLNREMTTLAPLLEVSCPIEVLTHTGLPEDEVLSGYRYFHELPEKYQMGIRSYLLISGGDGMLVILRNMDYQMSREANNLGKEPRFSHRPKKDVWITVNLPQFLADSWREAPHVTLVDPLTLKKVSGVLDENRLKVMLPEVDLVGIWWIPLQKGLSPSEDKTDSGKLESPAELSQVPKEKGFQ